ncbi:RHS repeat domain-containing protein [Prevotella multiformis]|nr:RHS repeat-associated core domain-containing protein [Prevotella multiformis]
MVMSFGRMSEPLTKVQKVDSTTTAGSYDFAYRYEDSNHPTAPTQIGHDHYTYDANGNPTLVTNDSTNTTREMYWDEDNRLMVLSDNGKTSRYTYNAAGERIMKSYGTMEGVYINGAPQGITFHETDNFTLYPASIISINKNRFTKHYFLGDKRVASRIGTGLFNNVYGRNGSYVTAGQQDYAERMNQIQRQKEAYYRQQGIAPGVPTMKGAYGDPENTHIGYNSIIRELGNHDVPQGWIQTPHPNTTPGTNPGPPVSWNDPSNPDDPQAGYGYIPNDTTKEETFFYHSDHLGSTSYITDEHANITQYDAYLPYGELLVDEHSSSEDLPYKFNGKQFDEETGLYYYGARYMNPMASIWYGVDPMSLTKPTLLSYVYCSDNPIRYYDKNGKIGIDGVIIGGVAGGASEYLSIMFQKMDNLSISSFVKANKSLTWKDGVSIAYNVGTGAISGALDNGISTMVKIVRNPIAKWILKEGIGIILEGVESAISKMITGKSIDVKAIVAQTLISKGFGHILPIAYIKKATIGARQNYQRALKALKDYQSRRSPNAKLVSKALAGLKEAKLNYGLLSGFLTGLKTTHKQITRKAVELLPKEYGDK